jgi:hypothetical protein
VWRCARGSGARRETVRCFHRAGYRTTLSDPSGLGPAAVRFRLRCVVSIVERHREVLDTEFGGIEGIVGSDVVGRDRVFVLLAAGRVEFGEVLGVQMVERERFVDGGLG